MSDRILLVSHNPPPMIARHLGASVGRFEDGRIEFGFYDMRLVPGTGDFLEAPTAFLQSHFHGFDLPCDTERLAESDHFPNQAFHCGPSIGLQFHPEAPAGRFRQSQERYTSHHARPGCPPRAAQDAVIEAAQDGKSRWFTRFLARMFGQGPSVPAPRA